MCNPVDDREDDDEDMHEKIREGESSRAVSNVEVHCCPSSFPSFFVIPRIKSDARFETVKRGLVIIAVVFAIHST